VERVIVSVASAGCTTVEPRLIAGQALAKFSVANDHVESPMKSANTVRSLAPMLRLHTWAFPVIVVVGLLQSLSEGFGIGLFIPLLRGLVGTAPAAAQGGWLVARMEAIFQHVPSDNRQAVIAASLFAVVLATALLAYAHGRLFTWFDGSIAHHLRRSIFSQLLTVGFGIIENDRSGRLLNVLASDTWRTSEALKILVHLTISATTVAVYIALLVLMSWRLTLVVAVGMLLVSGAVRLFTKGVRELGERVTHDNSELAHRMVEGIDGMRVIRAFGREPYEQNRFDAASERLRRTILRMGYIEGAVHPVHEILMASLLLAVLFVTARSATDISVLLVFVFVLYRLQPRVKDFEACRVRLAALASSVDAVTSVLDTAGKEYVHSGTVVHPGFDKAIVFDQVSFQYEQDGDLALADASFSIPAGQTTAFVGPSGGGKSTVIKLILRFYDPTSGRILTDGRPLSEFDLDSWRGQIAVVGQDGYLFNATVRENIKYGRLDASDEAVVDAARRADAHAFIERLPNKYDTVLGHHGVRLSGGQRQRISLARAIVRNPRILILDEATNALDSISEQWIQETLAKMKDNRTVIVIAHRLATIEQADQIVVLEKGRVRERGTLRDLVLRDDLFATMYRLQHRSTVAFEG
jgi:ATP-binding cassette, subfamily B, bacterial MsbA